MKCSKCKVNEVEFVCKFCGRLICVACKAEKPYILAVYDEDSDKPKMIVVEDAACCGMCHPKPDPITVAEIE